jgi:hypothetical protein
MGLTGQGNFHLRVKKDSRGKPFLMLEPSGRDKDIFQGGFISLTLREGITYAEAQALADEMRKHIAGAAITTDS